jgi:hypothetical protein
LVGVVIHVGGEVEVEAIVDVLLLAGRLVGIRSFLPHSGIGSRRVRSNSCFRFVGIGFPALSDEVGHLWMEFVPFDS